ncbi:hypothetical protein XENOCAPTIV_028860 [Xenoophorus captivus]|uniref:EF-hand domain-containing protein n=1 Tax=Xenoophorus captivus TaxID=1517983 RepID=A0ABV0S3Q0_9TELE
MGPSKGQACVFLKQTFRSILAIFFLLHVHYKPTLYRQKYWVTFLLHRLDWHLIPEIPGFLSEDECRVVMQLAQLKGLMESQLMVQEGQEELAKELDLSPEEIFNLLDINQDGQLQLHEVYVSLWI